MTTDTLPDQAWLDRYNERVTRDDRTNLHDVRDSVELLRREGVEPRIEKSIALLTEKGHDVVLEIDLGELEMHDCHRCIAGQLLGDFREGLAQLEVSAAHCWDDGYAFDLGDSPTLGAEDWAAFTWLWEDALLRLAQEQEL